MLFVEFVVEFIHFGPGLGERAPACRGDLIDAPFASADPIEVGLEQTGLLQSMEEGVKRSRADAIAVMLQLLHHGQTEDWVMRRMDQHVDPNEPVIKFALMIDHRIDYTANVAAPACLLSKFDI
jgi:hypothetical protein